MRPVLRELRRQHRHNSIISTHNTILPPKPSMTTNKPTSPYRRKQPMIKPGTLLAPEMTGMTARP
jgi:hypothetical protein